MKRWHKALIAGLAGGAGGYAVDALLSTNKPYRFAMAAVPGAIVGLAAGAITYLVSEPGPGEEGLMELGDLWAPMNQQPLPGSRMWQPLAPWPPSALPAWTFIEGKNLPRTKMPDGAAGVMRSR